MKGLTADNLEFEVLPVGTRVRHKKHPELIGKIYSHEYHSPGHYSALPYTVEWDNNDLAHQLLGILPIWPNWENLESLTPNQG